MGGDDMDSHPLKGEAPDPQLSPKSGEFRRGSVEQLADLKRGDLSPEILQNLETSIANMGDGNDIEQVSVLAMIFGTNNDEKHTGGEEEDFGEVPFHPDSRFRALWERIIMWGIAYHSMYWPAWIGFNYQGDISSMYVVDKFVVMLTIVDIVLNFFTGFNDGGTIEMRKTVVYRHYISGNFWIDVLGSLPLDLLMYIVPHLAVGEPDHLGFRYEGVIRGILLLSRFFRYLAKWQEQLHIDVGAIRVGKLMFLIVLFSHTNACIQFLSARVEGFPEDSWVVKNNLVDAGSWAQYTYALFNALSHMLCIGYGAHGDLMAPTTDADLATTIVSMITGASLYVVLVGIIASIILSLDHSGGQYKEKIDVWKQYFHYRSLPKDLRERILVYYSLRWHTHKFFYEEKLMTQIPKCLETDIHMFSCEYLLEKVPLFKLCSKNVVASVVSCLKPNSCLAGEWVYQNGERALDMYFIVKGEVQIVIADDTIVTTLSDGSYFGEFPLIYESVKTRTAGAKCGVFTQLCTLSKTDFDFITSIYPEFKDVMEQIADARQKRTQKTKEDKDISDNKAADGSDLTSRAIKRLQRFSGAYTTGDNPLPPSRPGSAASSGRAQSPVPGGKPKLEPIKKKDDGA